MITLVPLIRIGILAALFFLFPHQSNRVIGQVRFFFGDTMGLYYLAIGLGVLFVSLWLSFTKYGDMVLRKPDKRPKYSFFAWGTMIFTCGLAADILFYSFADCADFFREFYGQYSIREHYLCLSDWHYYGSCDLEFPERRKKVSE